MQVIFIQLTFFKIFLSANFTEFNINCFSYSYNEVKQEQRYKHIL